MLEQIQCPGYHSENNEIVPTDTSSPVTAVISEICERIDVRCPYLTLKTRRQCQRPIPDKKTTHVPLDCPYLDGYWEKVVRSKKND